MSPTPETSDSYWTLAEPSEGEYSEKRSKFLAYAYPVTTEEEALERVREVRARYYDARHVCWAYRLGPTGEPYRANDDGEPSGTAGKPIHGILVSLGLTLGALSRETHDLILAAALLSISLNPLCFAIADRLGGKARNPSP